MQLDKILANPFVSGISQTGSIAPAYKAPVEGVAPVASRGYNLDNPRAKSDFAHENTPGNKFDSYAWLNGLD